MPNFIADLDVVSRSRSIRCNRYRRWGGQNHV